MTEDSRNPWQTLDSRVVYANSWMTVREDSVIRPDGQPGICAVVQIRPSVGLLIPDNSKKLGSWPSGGSWPGLAFGIIGLRALANTIA